MRTIRYAFWAIVALCLILIGIANRDPVTLHAMPQALADLLSGILPGGEIQTTIQMPLFLAIFIGVAIGLVIGFLWEWLREVRIRAHGRSKEREADALRREVADLRSKSGDAGDDVLALLDGSKS